MPILVCNIARRLARQHEVIVYSPRGYLQEDIECIDGVEYRRKEAAIDKNIGYLIYGINKRIPEFFHALRKKPYFASILYDLEFIVKVAKDLQTQNCDIVHIHEESQFINILRIFNPRLKIVLHMHCDWLTQLNHKMIESRIKNADMILGCSNYITRRISNSFPSLERCCQTLYNGVDLSDSTNVSKNIEKSGKIQLLYLSRITPEKGLHVLLDALKEIVTKNSDVCLEVVGYLTAFSPETNIWLSDDPQIQKLASFYRKGSQSTYLEYLKKKIVSLNLVDHVTFHGLIPHEEKIKLYQTSDIFIQPSVWNEPFGMGIVEAMEYQLPVVATNVGGIPEIFDKSKCGLLVKADDSQSLANAIFKLISDAKLREEMGRLGRKRAESFSWDNVATNLLSLYLNMLNHG